MASYAALAQGNRNGPVITPGASQASRLVDMVLSGAHASRRRQIGADELAVISLWINAGARFDGGDPTAPLGQRSPMMADRCGNASRNVEFLRDLRRCW